MKPFRSLTPDERFELAETFAGKTCRVTYVRIAGSHHRETETGVVVGAAIHLTNGTSNGELVIMAAPGKRWVSGGRRHHATCIALSCVVTIELMPAVELGNRPECAQCDGKARPGHLLCDECRARLEVRPG